MGERGARNEPADADDLKAMSAIVREAIEAGAVGVSTSRTILHKAVDGEPVPGTFAAEDELFMLGRALAEVGRGVFELAPAGIQGEDLSAPDREVAWMRRLAAETGRPITYGFLQHDVAPRDWERLLEVATEAHADGIPLRPQITGRPIGMLLGLQGFNPFVTRPTYLALRELPLEERVAELRKPEGAGRDPGRGRPRPPAVVHRHGPRPDLRARRPARLRAAARGVDRRRGAPGSTRRPTTCSTTCCCAVRATSCSCARWSATATSSWTPSGRCSLHPATVLGVGDGGAHVSVICDASTPTYMLTHWARDRSRGPKLPIETVVHKMTKNNADLYGFADRGVIAPGLRADINVVDLDRLTLHAPEFRHDLPSGAPRLVQEAEGYVATLVEGTVTRRHDTDTGARPGGLVRSGGKGTR